MGAQAEIGVLLDQYLISLDDDKLDDDWARRLFTADATIEFPISKHEGIEGMAAYHRDALAMFESTQHLNSPAVVVLDSDDERGGDRATLRANLISTHVHLAVNAPPGGDRAPLFATGTLITGEARRTPAGWRLRSLSFRLVWASGSPPPQPAGAAS